MEVKMRLHPEPFNLIKDGIKKVEFRVRDEKRGALNINDEITFISRLDPSDTIKTKIVDLKIYKNFEELFDEEQEKLTKYYKGSKQEFVDSFNEYYPIEKQKDYPPLAIHIEKI